MWLFQMFRHCRDGFWLIHCTSVKRSIILLRWSVQSSNFTNRYFHFWLREQVPIISLKRRDMSRLLTYYYAQETAGSDLWFASLMSFPDAVTLCEASDCQNADAQRRRDQTIRGFKVRNLFLYLVVCARKSLCQKNKVLRSKRSNLWKNEERFNVRAVYWYFKVSWSQSRINRRVVLRPAWCQDIKVVFESVTYIID